MSTEDKKTLKRGDLVLIKTPDNWKDNGFENKFYHALEEIKEKHRWDLVAEKKTTERLSGELLKAEQDLQYWKGKSEENEKLLIQTIHEREELEETILLLRKEIELRQRGYKNPF